MRKIDSVQELREVQMKVMDAIHCFCIKNKICYSISSGTLLGAVRHKGYIPWDDDIDIYMPRDSFELFVKTFNCSQDRYKLLTPEIDSKYPYPFAKVIDSYTLVNEKANVDYPLGVWVDIFVVDGAPNSQIAKIFKSCIFRFLNMLFYFKVGNGKVRRPIDLLYKSIPLSSRCVYHILEKFKKSGKSTLKVGNVSMVSSKQYFYRSCMDTYIDIPFEDRVYKCMSGYDEYLRKTYGNYMVIPPVEKQIRHNYDAYWV